MKIKILIILTLISISIISSSCKKKQGCTDPNSINYNPEAEKDNGSCTYKGKVVFWELNTDALGITVVVMADGTSGNITKDFTGTPDCDATGCFTFTANPGTYSFHASDPNDGLEWDGSVTITSEGCTKQRLSR